MKRTKRQRKKSIENFVCLEQRNAKRKKKNLFFPSFSRRKFVLSKDKNLDYFCISSKKNNVKGRFVPVILEKQQ